MLTHRESNEVAQDVDRLFGVSAVLSGWENVAASQQDAFSWRALAEHLSVFSCKALMTRALEVRCVLIESRLVFISYHFYQEMIRTASDIGFHRVPLSMTEDLPVLLRGVNDSFVLLNEQGLDEQSIVAQCPFPELFIGLPCDVSPLVGSIVNCAVLVQQQRLVPRIPVIEAYASLMQTLVSKVSMADGSLGQYQPSAFVIDGLSNEPTLELVRSLYIRASEDQKHLVRISPKHCQYFHQAKTKWAYIAMCPQISVNNRLDELQRVQHANFEEDIDNLCEWLETQSWQLCSRSRDESYNATHCRDSDREPHAPASPRPRSPPPGHAPEPHAPASPPPRSPPPAHAPEPHAGKPPLSSSLHLSTSAVIVSTNNSNYSDEAVDVPCDSFEQVDSLIDELVERARVAFQHIHSGSSEFLFFSICYSEM